MPIYEFECPDCGSRFEELVGGEVAAPACPSCGGSGARRLLSPVSPPGRALSGAKKRDSDLRRSEREAARRDRIADARKARRSL